RMVRIAAETQDALTIGLGKNATTNAAIWTQCFSFADHDVDPSMHQESPRAGISLRAFVPACLRAFLINIPLIPPSLTHLRDVRVRIHLPLLSNDLPQRLIDVPRHPL